MSLKARKLLWATTVAIFLVAAVLSYFSSGLGSAALWVTVGLALGASGFADLKVQARH
ncbi:hypothetical protein [Rhodococcus qingshengii]|uniref:hypothetical protein n=1 Tax=Rhodococcus qingshengii TaxID=334542 RepID=UPI000815B6FC|nr:hypothetical protein [Rhodococcus qingshengii]SCC69103.1 hypothetical protein GA0061093_12724 [Rhodococcus qingshengii]